MEAQEPSKPVAHHTQKIDFLIGSSIAEQQGVTTTGMLSYKHSVNKLHQNNSKASTPVNKTLMSTAFKESENKIMVSKDQTVHLPKNSQSDYIEKSKMSSINNFADLAQLESNYQNKLIDQRFTYKAPLVNVKSSKKVTSLQQDSSASKKSGPILNIQSVSRVISNQTDVLKLGERYAKKPEPVSRQNELQPKHSKKDSNVAVQNIIFEQQAAASFKRERNHARYSFDSRSGKQARPSTQGGTNCTSKPDSTPGISKNPSQYRFQHQVFKPDRKPDSRTASAIQQPFQPIMREDNLRFSSQNQAIADLTKGEANKFFPKQAQLRSPKFAQEDSTKEFLQKVMKSLNDRFENIDELGRPRSFFSVSEYSQSDSMPRKATSPLQARSRLAEHVIQESFKDAKRLPQVPSETDTTVKEEKEIDNSNFWKKKNPKVTGEDTVKPGKISSKKPPVGALKDASAKSKNREFLRNELKKQKTYEITKKSVAKSLQKPTSTSRRFIQEEDTLVTDKEGLNTAGSKEQKKQPEKQLFDGSTLGNIDENTIERCLRKTQELVRGNKEFDAHEQLFKERSDQFFIDYYLKQSEKNKESFATKRMSKFEKNLVGNLKKIKETSQVLDFSSGNVTPGGEPMGLSGSGSTSVIPPTQFMARRTRQKSSGEEDVKQLARQQQNLFSQLTERIKSKFKIDKKSEAQTHKLFEMICLSSQCQDEQKVAKSDLGLFLKFVKENSDNKMASNKIYIMIQRLERALPPRQAIGLEEFMKFVCQPDPVALNSNFLSNRELVKYFTDLLVQHQGPRTGGGKQRQGGFGAKELRAVDVDRLWTQEDHRHQKELQIQQKQNRQRISVLKEKLDDIVFDCEGKLLATIKTMKESHSDEDKRTLAEYQRKLQDEKQRTLDLRNRRLQASKVYGLPADSLGSKHPEVLNLEKNPFINERDFNNIDMLFRKLNQTIDRLKMMREKAVTLSQIEQLQKKLKQFGEGLGIIEESLSKKDEAEKENLIMRKITELKTGKKVGKAFFQQKLPQLSSNQNTDEFEEEYLRMISEQVYSSLIEINQMIRRREIMTTINNKFIHQAQVKEQTWEDKIKSKQGAGRKSPKRGKSAAAASATRKGKFIERKQESSVMPGANSHMLKVKNAPKQSITESQDQLLRGRKSLAPQSDESQRQDSKSGLSLRKNKTNLQRPSTFKIQVIERESERPSSAQRKDLNFNESLSSQRDKADDTSRLEPVIEEVPTKKEEKTERHPKIPAFKRSMTSYNQTKSSKLLRFNKRTDSADLSSVSQKTVEVPKAQSSNLDFVLTAVIEPTEKASQVKRGDDLEDQGMNLDVNKMEELSILLEEDEKGVSAKKGLPSIVQSSFLDDDESVEQPAKTTVREKSISELENEEADLKFQRKLEVEQELERVSNLLAKPVNLLKFQDEVDHCTGELWLFRSTLSVLQQGPFRPPDKIPGLVPIASGRGKSSCSGSQPKPDLAIQVAERAFQVYSFKNPEILTYGANFMSLEKGILSLITHEHENIGAVINAHPQHFAWTEPKSLIPTGKSKLYYVHPESSTLSQVLGKAVGEGERQPPLQNIRKSGNTLNIVQEEDEGLSGGDLKEDFNVNSCGFITFPKSSCFPDSKASCSSSALNCLMLNNQTGKVKVVESLPMTQKREEAYGSRQLVQDTAGSKISNQSTLTLKQFRFVSTSNSNYIALHTLDGMEVDVVGSLMPEEDQGIAELSTLGRSRPQREMFSRPIDRIRRKQQSPKTAFSKAEAMADTQPKFDYLKYMRFKFQVPILKVSTGKNHLLAVDATPKARVFSWGSGASGQLGHSDYEDLKYPRIIDSIAVEVRDILAVGNVSLVLDDLNSLYTFGCNLYGQLGDESKDQNRSIPKKLARKFLPHKILMLRGSYTEAYHSYNETDSLKTLAIGSTPKEGFDPGLPREMTTLSFMNELQDIYVWSSFNIPYEGQRFVTRSIDKQGNVAPIRVNEDGSATAQSDAISASDALSPKGQNPKAIKEDVRFLNFPKKLGFLFGKHSNMKIKNYVIDYHQIALIAQPRSPSAGV